MVKDKRKATRRPMRYAAWVVLENEELHGCSLSDISETGARLEIDETKPIPDDFTLLLTSNGSAKRKCHVVWRKPRQVGVSFIRAAAGPASEQASLAPVAAPEAKTATEPVETVNVEVATADAK